MQTATTFQETALIAAMRALAADPAFSATWQADIHTDPLAVSGAPVLPEEGLTRAMRGAADIAALALRAHDHALHLRLRPELPTEARIFDLMEETRVALAAARGLRGVQHNVQNRFEEKYVEESPELTPAYLAALLLWQEAGEAAATGDARVAMLQARLARHLPALVGCIGDQQAYAKRIKKLIPLLLEPLPGKHEPPMTPERDHVSEATPEPGDTEDTETPDEAEAAPGAGEHSGQTPVKSDRPPGRQEAEAGMTPAESGYKPPAAALNAAQPYHPFTTAHDLIAPAWSLAAPEELTRLREQLDKKLAEVEGSFARISARLQRLLMARQRRAWEFDLEDGILHPARLARLVSSPGYRHIYRHEKETSHRDTVITLLLDNSGSMRGRPISIAALSADILARTLERAGVRVEILGFTTRDWKGGKSQKDWEKAGRPARPGRIGDLLHIVYKPADMPLARSRRGLGLMLKEGLLKENIDGEALLWAESRLLARPESRRILMVISDGAPVDDATLSANSPSCLDRHLREVIARMEQEGRVELLAIGIGHDVSRYYRQSVTLQDAARLGEVMAGELIALFSGKT